MFEWIAANAVTIIALAAVLLAAGLAVRSVIKSRKRGGCTGDCASCGACCCCKKDK
ncbi:MAG: FeoB-associated Cys-rich membrane protein [Clostridia bacterium]|nr:FeoB-associated Cys-rich membrane protein [Clostridia bacterium]MBR4799531.1 FeoB-associated Cys-rich membrane protein [Clostridia bacterium]MBR5745664.1 FeoB-associated Cys-rich membrane protein [Clostridia bacterium]